MGDLGMGVHLPDVYRSMVIGLICASQLELDQDAYAKAVDELRGVFHDLL